MPRANRYILSGRTCHLTHRRHNRGFLFRFARDRTEYCRRLRLAVREFRISLLGYCITSNHTHLLILAGIEQSLAAGKVAREPLWTESIAVGTERFVRDVGEETRNRLQLDVVRSDGGAWVVREAQVAYDSFSGSKSEPKPVPGMVEGP